jgi:hypothetical protein
MNQKELACKQIFEELFPGYKFIKIRHPRMKNPGTNRSLELDLYCKELNLACEYNGPQHYKFMEFYHKIEDEFQKQKCRDVVKEGFCDLFGIELITIPNLEKYNEIRDFIIKSLDARNIQYNSTAENKPLLEDYKICNDCGKEKLLDEFSRDKTKSDGYRGICKTCFNTSRKNARIIRQKKNAIPKTQTIKVINPILEEFHELQQKVVESISSLENAYKNGLESLEAHKRIYEISQIHRNPPSNTFNIPELRLKNKSDTETNITLIKSSLALFLVQKKSLCDVEIKVRMDKNYWNNDKLIAILPVHVLLTFEEKREFLNIICNYSDNIDMCTSILSICIECSGFIYPEPLVDFIIKLLDNEYGIIFGIEKFSHKYHHNTWTFIFPENIKFNPIKKKKIEEQISEYIVNTIIENS